MLKYSKQNWLLFLWTFLVLISSIHMLQKVSAQEDGTQDPHVKTKLVSSVSKIIPGETFYLALQQKIEKGWHVYWRNPGSSGEPVSLEWTLPEGFQAGEIVWPAPRVIPTGPILNYGFEGTVYFPVKIKVPKNIPPGSTRINLNAFWLTCKDICIPETASFSLPLEVVSSSIATKKRRTPYTKNIQKALNSTPKPRENVKASIHANEKQLFLEISAPFLEKARVRNLYFFPYDSGLIDHDLAQKVKLRGKGAQMILAKGPEAETVLEKPVYGLLAYEEGKEREVFEVIIPASSSQQSLEALHSGGAFSDNTESTEEKQGTNPVGKSSQEGVHKKNQPSFLIALIFAFLGGLILNLMPCVFPVLSIKAMSLAKTAHEKPSEIRRHGVFFLVGVLVSFLGLAGLLIILKALGAEIGWGFQLQSPLVVAGLALLMFLVGLNFLGFFEVQASLGDKTLRLTERSDHWGPFFTGVLTVLVATPCTAPFMATALGFAITQSWYVSLFVFLSLGLGLAFPFFILSFFPGMLKLLPKPGVWMVRFKEFLAFPMLAACVWLVWVLTRQVGADGVLLALSAGLSVVLFLWALKAISKGWWAKLLSGFAAISLIFSLYFLSTLSPVQKQESLEAQNAEITKLAWSPETVQKHTSKGKVVFVDFTADWCVTCKVNEKLVLDQKHIKQYLQQKDVVFLVADWTNRDPKITQALKKYNRAGVPLYLVYPAKANSEPYILPQFLTGGIVKKMIERALKTEK